MCFLTLTASCLHMNSTAQFNHQRAQHAFWQAHSKLSNIVHFILQCFACSKKKRCIKTAALVIYLLSKTHFPKTSSHTTKVLTFQTCPNMWTLAWTITFQKMSLLRKTPHRRHGGTILLLHSSGISKSDVLILCVLLCVYDNTRSQYVAIENVVM